MVRGVTGPEQSPQAPVGDSRTPDLPEDPRSLVSRFAAHVAGLEYPVLPLGEKRPPVSPITDDGRQVEVMAGYLVVPVEGCTCDGGGEFPLRAECGYEPAVPLAEVEAAIARARRAEGHPASTVTDDMVEAAARELFAGPHHRTKVVDGEVVEYTVTWDESEDGGNFGRDIYRRQARRVLSAALAGCTPVALPEPDGRTYAGSARWDASARRVIAKVDKQGRPYVRVDEQIWLDGEAESVGLALVAAAREARRLASGSQEDSDD